MHRSESLNDSPLFIEALAAIVRERVDGQVGRSADGQVGRWADRQVNCRRKAKDCEV